VNLRHLEVFCAVVGCESFSAAAEQLIMTQPAVSMQVQAVERHFGVQLLERRNRRTVPTEAGQVVYKWALNVLRTESLARKGIDDLKHAQAGRVVVGSSMTIGSHVLPPILSRFKRQHAGAEIVVRLGERPEICGEIINGTIDCGVVIAREIPPDLKVEPLGREAVVFICGPGHRLAHRKRVCIEDLEQESFILAPSGSSYRRLIDELLAEQGLRKVTVFMELDGTDSVKRAVQQGLGIGVALRSGVEWELEHGLLHEVPMRTATPLVDIGLVYHPRRHQSPMIESFTSYLKDQLSEQLRRSRERASAVACSELVRAGRRSARRAAVSTNGATDSDPH